MKILIKIIGFLIIAVSFSCEKHELNDKCDDCRDEEPSKTEIWCELESDYYAGARIIVYEGAREDNILLGTYTANTRIFKTSVRLNKNYTIEASYYIDGIQYTAVNSTTPRVKYEKALCDDPCYYIYDRIVDLTLKYTK